MIVVLDYRYRDLGLTIGFLASCALVTTSTKNGAVSGVALPALAIFALACGQTCYLRGYCRDLLHRSSGSFR